MDKLRRSCGGGGGGDGASDDYDVVGGNRKSYRIIRGYRGGQIVTGRGTPDGRGGNLIYRLRRIYIYNILHRYIYSRVYLRRG